MAKRISDSVRMCGVEWWGRWGACVTLKIWPHPLFFIVYLTWDVTLVAMSVGSKRLELSDSFGCGDLEGNIVIDSGTTRDDNFYPYP